MGNLIVCIYLFIAVIMFVVTIKIQAKDEYLCKEDIKMFFVLFGVIWPIGLCITIYEFGSDMINRIGDKLEEWVNK